ncbi:hypothetical protein AX16_008649 [Volvariella volvacea WC 439]|nr:hypothetical protein AX16_008649 [Volvariella volvacea WC 439]
MPAPSLRSLLVLSLLVLTTSLTPLFQRLRHAFVSSLRTDNMSVDEFQSKWRRAFDALPSTPDNIPAFFFAHGSPVLAFPIQAIEAGVYGEMGAWGGPTSPHARFLGDFGPFLLQKYKPKGIVVFSAHWETVGDRLVTDYGDENPLLMDYYGFQPELYQLKFKSKGDSALSNRVVQLFKEAGMSARLTPKSEPRGEDGRGFAGPGLDHGVFVPFRLMFGETFDNIPIVQASIDSSLSPERNWAIGQAVAKLRHEGILVLSGGLPIHNLRDRSCFSPKTAKPLHHEFNRAVYEAVRIQAAQERKRVMIDLTKHAGFRASNPREEHFVPLYVAAGAGGDTGKVHVLAEMYGLPTIAFGVEEQ